MTVHIFPPYRGGAQDVFCRVYQEISHDHLRASFASVDATLAAVGGKGANLSRMMRTAVDHPSGTNQFTLSQASARGAMVNSIEKEHML
jgi:hypothetical protein